MSWEPIHVVSKVRASASSLRSVTPLITPDQPPEEPAGTGTELVVELYNEVFLMCSYFIVFIYFDFKIRIT